MSTMNDDEVVYDSISAAAPSTQTAEDQLKQMTLGDEEKEEQEGGEEGEVKKRRGFIKGIGKGVKTLLRSASFKSAEHEREAAAKARIESHLKKCRYESLFVLLSAALGGAFFVS